MGQILSNIELYVIQLSLLGEEDLMNEWSKILLYILSGSGLLTGLISLFKQRKVMKWNDQYQRGVESLKGDIHQSNEIMKSSLNILSQGYNQAQAMRLDAIEEMWSYVLGIREYSSEIITFYTILLPKEYNEESDYLSSMKMNLSSDKELIRFFSSMDGLEKQRPYLGEKSWALFTVYRAFLGRLVLIFIKGIDKGSITEWHQDSGLMTILETALDEKEYEEYTNAKLGKMDSLTEIIYILEQKILNEINRTVSGTYASEENFNQARKIHTLLSGSESNVGWSN